MGLSGEDDARISFDSLLSREHSCTLAPLPAPRRPGRAGPRRGPDALGGAAMDKTDFLALSRVPGYKYKLLDGTLTKKTHPPRYLGTVARVS